MLVWHSTQVNSQKFNGQRADLQKVSPVGCHVEVVWSFTMFAFVFMLNLGIQWVNGLRPESEGAELLCSNASIYLHIHTLTFRYLRASILTLIQKNFQSISVLRSMKCFFK